MKRKKPQSELDEIMPVDNLPGMAFYFQVVRVVADILGKGVKGFNAFDKAITPRYAHIGVDLYTAILALAACGTVLALWAVPRMIALGLRKVRRPGYYEREKARRRALAHERRSTRRRTTLNPAPTPEALLSQFGRIRRNPREMLLFGSMLEDLEAYVDNELVRDPDGRIVGRHGGIKRWLRENCPELGRRYHTVMRYKAMAKRFKQVIDLEDPVPVAYALAAAETPVEVEVGEPPEMQLRCGPEFENHGECEVEAVTRERFELLKGAAYVADGQRRLAEVLAASINAREILACCRATKRDMDEMLAMRLDPDATPSAPVQFRPPRRRTRALA